MTPTVYFFGDASRMREGVDGCLRKISEDFGPGKVGFKVHFGEEGNVTHIPGKWLEGVRSQFTEPVFVECNVMYRGKRTRRQDHVATAVKHGFGFIPIDILDGEMGEASTDVAINVGRTKAAKLGAGILNYGKLVSVAHFKGHIAAGFGGCLKNVGMGLGSRSGKMDMHSIISPYVKSDKCVACGTCVGDCPADAIVITDKAAVIDPKRCIGCAHCIAVCPKSAIDIPWEMTQDTNRILMEKVAEYALAAAKGRSWWHMNVLANITYNCDCMGIKEKPFMHDIGILLSRDPVACDQAALDLVKKRNGGKDPFLKKFGIDGEYILEYGEKIGLGSRKYALEPMM